VRELQRQITALKRQIQNDRIASGPDALAARIQRLIRNTPARTGYDFEIWESDMTSPSSYRIRSDVVQRPIRSGTTTLESPNGMAYYLPSKHRFYIQWDSMGASTLHYYGPFDGDPVEVLGLK
jgi:hypothetical protein